jgi:hypothetical protein
MSAMGSLGINAFASKSDTTEYKYNTNRHIQTPFLMHFDFHHVIIKLFIKK